MTKRNIIFFMFILGIISMLITGCQSTPQKQYSKGTEELAEKICDFAESHQTDEASTLILIGLCEGKKEKILTFTYSTIPRYMRKSSEGGIQELGHTKEKYYIVTKKGISEKDYIDTDEGGYMGLVGSEERASWYIDVGRLSHISELMDIAEYIISDGASKATSSNE